MFGKLRGISVNGYRPFNGLNIFLSAVGGIALLISIAGLSSGEEELGILAVVVSVVILAILLFRNKKVKSVPKMIIFSVASLVLGSLAVIVLLLSALSAGMSVMNGGSANLGGTFSSVFGSSDGNKNNGGQDAGFSKQDDLNAQMQGYANAQQYQDATGFSGHDIDPDDDYTRA